MKTFVHFLIISLQIFLLPGCDDGKIYPEEQKDVKGGKGTMAITFTGEKAWPEEYLLVFGAFGDDPDMPVVSKIISKPASSGDEVSVTLNGLDERTKELSIAVVNKGRQPLYHFYRYAVKDPYAEMTLPMKEIDLADYNRIQEQVFDAYCIRCHGGGSVPAAGLDLTAGKSYHTLVNKPATLSKAGRLLVEPDKPGRSFLTEILEEDIIRYNHTDVLPEKELITLIKTWIENGAHE
ncbi:hypothetical protein [Parabacteroides sp. PF5-9]|uniref:hypothetical protein n=1 Tax=Parabacteroides sp. PF5-9 TaxID=1742404 RepID=UPI0024766980|nr:hypothetical protein [Parabacteroides sp. PF5-9]MDH6359029.1 hypothetical protein [Parabacteroides sp. PF5-9]